MGALAGVLRTGSSTRTPAAGERGTAPARRARRSARETGAVRIRGSWAPRDWTPRRSSSTGTRPNVRTRPWIGANGKGRRAVQGYTRPAENLWFSSLVRTTTRAPARRRTDPRPSGKRRAERRATRRGRKRAAASGPSGHSSGRRRSRRIWRRRSAVARLARFRAADAADDDDLRESGTSPRFSPPPISWRSSTRAPRCTIETSSRRNHVPSCERRHRGARAPRWPAEGETRGRSSELAPSAAGRRPPRRGPDPTAHHRDRTRARALTKEI